MTVTRKVTNSAIKYLENDDVLIFTGPRQAGKTTILKQLQAEIEKLKSEKAVYFLNLEDPQYLDLLNKSPRNIFEIFTIDLSSKTFILIDEIQYLENPSNFLKLLYDDYKGKIKILASGSSAFYIDRKFNESLAGRKKIFHVNTLSFREFLRFKNELDLSVKNFSELKLLESKKVETFYHEYLIYGGYPKVVLAPPEEKINELKEIAFSYMKKDVYEANVRQEEVFYKLFRILASQIGNLLNANELASTLGVSKTAIDNYLYIMNKSFHIQFIKPFSGNLRSELIKMPKVYFSDLGLRNFFVNDFSPFISREDKGPLLENGFFRELLEKYDLEDVNFWRTTGQNEVDFIVEKNRAYEVKAGSLKSKRSRYKIFRLSYPKIPLFFVTLGNENFTDSENPSIKPWEL